MSDITAEYITWDFTWENISYFRIQHTQSSRGTSNAMNANVCSAASIQQYIQAAIGHPDRTELSPIPARDDAQVILDEIWKVLDSPVLPTASSSTSFYTYRNQLRRLSIKVANRYSVLPSSLLLKDIQCIDTKPHGVGGFAEVFCGTYKTSKVALKRLRVYTMMTETQKQNVINSFYRESLLWKNLGHDHILPFLGVAEDVFQGSICMVIPWMRNGNLRQYISEQTEKGQLTEATFVPAINRWLHQTAMGLAYLHSEGIVHGDLHAGNILVDNEKNARLCDFGMSLISEATAYNYGSHHGGGATRWSAPELFDPEEFGLTTSRPTFQSDVYAFACVVVELYSGQPPFPDLVDRQVPMQVVKGMRPSLPRLSKTKAPPDHVWSLTTTCWAQDPAARPSANTVVQSLESALTKDRIVAICQAVNKRQRESTCSEYERSWLQDAAERTIRFYNGESQPIMWILAVDQEFPPGALCVDDRPNADPVYITRACVEERRTSYMDSVIAVFLGTTDAKGAVIHGASSNHAIQLYEILVTSSEHVQWSPMDSSASRTRFVCTGPFTVTSRIVRVFRGDRWHITRCSPAAPRVRRQNLLIAGDIQGGEVLCYKE
ncbi:kinase-like domain-containing protein [Cristinia sonorae]|uniref:Kinase-like domain-containing protein n=1 Tax=Cristinia sonorae TaxID=1940300 RepID=A0A8K0US76_9AGAR|nr:kinase-like domain-containing protein [Cristinia sonorae]